MRIAIYSRKSKFTGCGESTQNQIHLCQKYAKEHFDTIESYKIYEDEGFSGGNMDRPQFKKMILAAKNKDFDLLMCYRLDRISRNVSHFSQIIQLLESHHIAFVSLKEQFDTSTPMGRAMMYISSVFAQLERETIAERIQDNMMQLAKTGRWLGGTAPTGFTSKPIFYLDDHSKKKKMFYLSPIDDQLLTVSILFKKYLQFQSLSKLETFCLNQCIYTKNHKNFHKYSIKSILTNPVYAKADPAMYEYFLKQGVYMANKKKDFDGIHGVMVYNKKLVEKGKSVITKDMNEWICAIGQHLGIIEGKTFVKVQKLLAKNRKKAPRKGTSNTALLSGIIRCGQCGSFMKIKYGHYQAHTKKRHFYYVCNTKSISHGHICKCNNLQGMTADQLVLHYLYEFLHPNLALDLSSIQKYILSSSTKNQLMVKQMKVNEQSIENLLNQLSQNPIITTNAYIFKKIQELDHENQRLQKTLQNENICLPSHINDLSEQLKNFNQIFVLPISDQKMWIKNIVDHVIWNGKDLKIVLKS